MSLPAFLPAPVHTASASVAARLRALEDVLLTRQLSVYGVAVSRILAAAAYVGLLLTNFEYRQILYGAASDWVQSYRQVSPAHAWTGLLVHLSPLLFTLFYVAVILVGIAFMLGWHARLTGPLLLLGAIQIFAMNPVVADQGDNILRIGLLLILFTDNAAVWSLDARRSARDPQARAWLPARVVTVLRGSRARTAKTVLHNAGVIALAGQLVIIYVAAGMYKTAGNGWRYGTAISYPLRLDKYRVFPFLDDLAVSSGLVVWFSTYFAVFLQLYFPVLMLNRVTRRVALAAVICLHLGIAILMGLPWFTLAMVAFDGIFVSRATYEALGRFVGTRYRRLSAPVRRRLGREVD